MKKFAMKILMVLTSHDQLGDTVKKTGVWTVRVMNSPQENRQMITIAWMDNFEAACQRAGQDHKLVLLDFFSPTCGGCQRLSAVTYSDAQVIDTITARFVLVQVNTQEAAGLPMVRRFAQDWTPICACSPMTGWICTAGTATCPRRSLSPNSWWRRRRSCCGCKMRQGPRPCTRGAGALPHQCCGARSPVLFRRLGLQAQPFSGATLRARKACRTLRLISGGR